MAGSYEAALWHPSLLENMGDAGEAIEQMLWLILRGVGHEEAVRLIKEGVGSHGSWRAPHGRAFVSACNQVNQSVSHITGSVENGSGYRA